MASPEINEIATSAGVALLILKEVFTFVKPQIERARSNGKDRGDDGNGRVTLAEIKKDIGHMSDDVKRAVVLMEKNSERISELERWKAVCDALDKRS